MTQSSTFSLSFILSSSLNFLPFLTVFSLLFFIPLFSFPHSSSCSKDSPVLGGSNSQIHQASSHTIGGNNGSNAESSSILDRDYDHHKSFSTSHAICVRNLPVRSSGKCTLTVTHSHRHSKHIYIYTHIHYTHPSIDPFFFYFSFFPSIIRDIYTKQWIEWNETGSKRKKGERETHKNVT